VTGRWPNWRARTGSTRTRSQLLDGAAGVFGSGGTEDAASEAQVDLLYRQIGQLKVENDLYEGLEVKRDMFLGSVTERFFVPV
jgi:hypothetical protein